MFFRKLCGLLSVFSITLAYERILIDQLRWDFLELENELLITNIDESNLARKFYEFDLKLKQIPEDILIGLSPIMSIPAFLYLYTELRIIENKYEKFRQYQENIIKHDMDSINVDSIIYDTVNKINGVNVTITKIYYLTGIYGGGIDSILDGIYKELLSNFWCKNFQQSPQQIFYNLYNIIALTDLKSYVMQQFTNFINKWQDEGNHTELLTSARHNYKERVKDAMQQLFKVKQADIIWRCDPKMHVKGQTYDEFTRLLQGHIQNEVDMSVERTCTQTCSKYYYTRSYGCYDEDSAFCKKGERCSGNLIGCFFVESHASICLSNQPSRRYDFIEFNSGETYGKKKYCPSQRTVFNSWTRWFVRCHYCVCLCDEHGPRSERHINLRPVMANTDYNRVVTGLRLVKHNKVLHIQIQEGKLLPYGYIDQTTVQWVPIDDYKITDKNVMNGKDFFSMTYSQRSIALDHLHVYENNYIITGARFKLVDKKIRFEIHVSAFDWKNGTVNTRNSQAISGGEPRFKVDLSGADVPIYTDQSSKIKLSDSTYYLEFTHTDFGKDAAQTTIPFIDTQEVINKPAVPLIGAGINYKGHKGFGGFITPTIKTYNYEKHVNQQLPEMIKILEIVEPDVS